MPLVTACPLTGGAAYEDWWFRGDQTITTIAYSVQTIQCVSNCMPGQASYYVCSTGLSNQAALSSAAAYWADEQPRENSTAQEVRYQQQLDAAVARQQEAKKKSEAMLRAMLNDDQRAQWDCNQTFEVLSAGNPEPRRYRLHHNMAGNIYLLNEEDAEVERFCIHTSLDVPIADNLIAQKLLLETDELQFLKTANRSVRNGDVGWTAARRAA